METIDSQRQPDDLAKGDRAPLHEPAAPPAAPDDETPARPLTYLEHRYFRDEAFDMRRP
jgi:hypothetical protein